MADEDVRDRPVAPLVLSAQERAYLDKCSYLGQGIHTSVRQLEADICSFIDRHNQNPKPFKWIKSADQILA
jgi:hypothetical protein